MVTGVPAATTELGEGAVRETDTPEFTLIVIDVFALCPDESDAYTVIVCDPD